jgi:hypothetical protein
MMWPRRQMFIFHGSLPRRKQQDCQSAILEVGWHFVTPHRAQHAAPLREGKAAYFVESARAFQKQTSADQGEEPGGACQQKQRPKKKATPVVGRVHEVVVQDVSVSQRCEEHANSADNVQGSHRFSQSAPNSASQFYTKCGAGQ